VTPPGGFPKYHGMRWAPILEIILSRFKTSRKFCFSTAPVGIPPTRPSAGAGKSTLLRALSGELPLQGGTRVEGDGPGGAGDGVGPSAPLPAPRPPDLPARVDLLQFPIEHSFVAVRNTAAVVMEASARPPLLWPAAPDGPP